MWLYKAILMSVPPPPGAKITAIIPKLEIEPPQLFTIRAL